MLPNIHHHHHHNNNHKCAHGGGSFVCDQTSSSSITTSAIFAISHRKQWERPVARQAPPHHSCQGNACMQRQLEKCWGLVVTTLVDWWWWGEEPDKFKAAASPTWSNGGDSGMFVCMCLRAGVRACVRARVLWMSTCMWFETKQGEGMRVGKWVGNGSVCVILNRRTDVTAHKKIWQWWGLQALWDKGNSPKQIIYFPFFWKWTKVPKKVLYCAKATSRFVLLWGYGN